jgi:hypothetical protein
MSLCSHFELPKISRSRSMSAFCSKSSTPNCASAQNWNMHELCGAHLTSRRVARTCLTKASGSYRKCRITISPHLQLLLFNITSALLPPKSTELSRDVHVKPSRGSNDDLLVTWLFTGGGLASSMCTRMLHDHGSASSGNISTPSDHPFSRRTNWGNISSFRSVEKSSYVCVNPRSLIHQMLLFRYHGHSQVFWLFLHRTQPSNSISITLLISPLLSPPMSLCSEFCLAKTSVVDTSFP